MRWLVAFYLLTGCAAVQERFDTVCDVVARADHYNAVLYTAVSRDTEATPETKDAAVDLSKTIVEAHNVCFEEPEE